MDSDHEYHLTCVALAEGDAAFMAQLDVLYPAEAPHPEAAEPPRTGPPDRAAPVRPGAGVPSTGWRSSCMQPPHHPWPTNMPKAPPFSVRRYVGVDTSGEIFDMGPDREPLDFTGPPPTMAETEVAQDERGYDGVCTLQGCGRAVPYRGYKSCCRICWYTDGREHGPLCDERALFARLGEALRQERRAGALEDEDSWGPWRLKESEPPPPAPQTPVKAGRRPCRTPGCPYLEHSKGNERWMAGYCCDKCAGRHAGADWAGSRGTVLSTHNHYKHCEREAHGLDRSAEEAPPHQKVQPPGTRSPEESSSGVDLGAASVQGAGGGAAGDTGSEEECPPPSPAELARRRRIMRKIEKQEAEARAKAARDADRDREQPKITLRAPVPPKQVKAEPESEESPAWGCLSSAA